MYLENPKHLTSPKYGTTFVIYRTNTLRRRDSWTKCTRT